MSDNLNNSHAVVGHSGLKTAVVMGATAFTFLVGISLKINLAHSLGTSKLGNVVITEALVMTVAGLMSFGLAPLAIRHIPEYRISVPSCSIRLLVTVALWVLSGIGLLGIPLDSAQTGDILGWLHSVPMIVFFLGLGVMGHLSNPYSSVLCLYLGAKSQGHGNLCVEPCRY